MEKEELCENVVGVRIVNDRVMEVVLVFEEDVMRLICWYALRSGRSFERAVFPMS